MDKAVKSFIDISTVHVAEESPCIHSWVLVCSPQQDILHCLNCRFNLTADQYDLMAARQKENPDD